VLDFRILGPLEVVGEDGPIRLGGPRQRATLAILLLHANRVVPVERLADELYAGRPPVTAVTQVQRQVSELRKVLGSATVIETRPPGYVLHVGDDAFDVARFERLTAGGRFADALALWRGPALADLAYEPFARAAVERLEELRLAVLEERIEIDLAGGNPARLVGELDALVAEHPLRERLHEQRMLALYRAGRPAEALDAYRDARRVLVEQVGLEPSARLQDLERAILAGDASLAGGVRLHVERHVVLAAVSADANVASVAAVAQLLGRDGGDVVFVRLVAAEDDVAEAAASLAGIRARTAAFTSDSVAEDVVRLATANDAEVVLLDTRACFDGDGVSGELASVFERSPADVCVVVGAPIDPGRAVVVPFAGGDHDWAALELAGWLAGAANAPLRLVGTKSDPRSGRRDASRLLADASLALQRVVGITAELVLAGPEQHALVDAVGDAGVVVYGISPRWRREGIGSARRALAGAGVPLLLVHRGPRPGALAPREARTRFTWTIDA
jgi:DNA-binding SARP family transcriptional activator